MRAILTLSRNRHKHLGSYPQVCYFLSSPPKGQHVVAHAAPSSRPLSTSYESPLRGLYASARLVLGFREGLVKSRQWMVFVPFVGNVLQDEVSTPDHHSPRSPDALPRLFPLQRERGSKSSNIHPFIPSSIYPIHLLIRTGVDSTG